MNHVSREQWDQKNYGGTLKAQLLLQNHVLVNDIPVKLSGGNTNHRRANRGEGDEFNKWKYIAQHFILSTTSTHLGVKIKDMKC